MKKKTMAIAATMASCIALSATFTGCSLISINSKADMEQVIASVDITAADKFETSDVKDYKAAVKSTSVVKRDLVSYFLNVGYSYIQNGTSYKDTFNMLLDALINNEVLIQYSTMKLLEAKAKETGKDAASVVAEFNSKFEKSEAEAYKSILTDEDVVLATYKLYSSLNTAIDNYEKTIIEEENDYAGTETRTTPTNLDTEQDDYYPQTDKGELNYGIYTGYGNYLLDNSGIYKDENALDGTTKATRIRAYNSFLNSLRRNNLVDSEKDGENLTDILKLNYVQNEYVSQLQARVINRYYKTYEDEQEKILTEESYIINRYNELLELQTDAYDTASAFESAMSGMSSTSFILYSPDTTDSEKFDGETSGRFGFVYNILLPFSAKQSARLAELNSIKTQNEYDAYYYNERNKLLKAIETEDQRSAWFNGKDKYAFKVEDSKYTENYFGKKDGREYLFFENNLTDSGEGKRYKTLQAYDGRYAYNGEVKENENGSYTLIGKKLTIDGMLDEFSAYIDFVLDKTGSVKINKTAGYYDEKQSFYKEKESADDEDEIDYSNFVYASGNVVFGDFDKANLFKTDTPQYKAMSAVNELQFAYTTDTSVLSQYIGYSVSAYETSYIKEFEYACKQAIANGEGSFVVCAGDYGWHIAYVTYAFDVNGGNVFGEQPNWDNMQVEGTFENLFYEWIKSTSISDITNKRRDQIISDFNNDSSVEKFEKRYKDLLELDSSNGNGNINNNNNNNGN